MRCLNFAALVLAGATNSAIPALAGPVTFITRTPADPHAIAVEVDQTQLHGTLAPGDLTALIAAGKQLFEARFTTADGAGRPLATQAQIPTLFKHPREVSFQRASGPDSNACTSCHNVPYAGGAGDFVANAFTSGGTESADFDNVDPQFSNERGTVSLFGSGLVELLAREMTADLKAEQAEGLHRARDSGEAVTLDLNSKGIGFGTLVIDPDGMIDVSGVDGVDDDLVVRPFSQKGVFTSLRSFSVTAMNAHHGMQSDERFSGAMTGEVDFDGDGVTGEISAGQMSALVAFQASLEPPEPVPFDNPDWQAMADRGEAIFNSAGCAACHTPALPLNSLQFEDPGPYDSAGTLAAHDVKEPAVYDLSQLSWASDLPRNDQGRIMVPLFSDMKRHVIADDRVSHFGNELLGQGFVPRDTFITGKLWGLADTAPYGHRGDLTTLDAAIRAHGGEGTQSRAAYLALDADAQADLITFLKTLRMPQ